MDSFADYINIQPNKGPELPLVHTTEYDKLSDIRKSHRLLPEADGDGNSKEAALYFFYGRPAYRDANRNVPQQKFDFCPICFVFRPNTVSTRINRIYPFDTGASRKGLYEPHLSRSAAVNKFSVPAIIESARRIIGGFFDTNDGYIRNSPRENLTFSATEKDAETYYKLITSDDPSGSDDRVSAIEIQVVGAADLQAGDLLAVILPTFLMEDEEFKRTLLLDWKAHPLTYDTDRGMRPTEFHGVVRQLVRDYYKEWRFI